MDEKYKGLIPGYTGVDFSGPVLVGGKEWITKQEVERNNTFNENYKLYKGRHGTDSGGPFVHPYGTKGKEEQILYVALNIIGEVSEIFADLVLGNGFSVNIAGLKNDSIEDLIDYEDWKLRLNNFVIMLSIYGVMGIQPYKYFSSRGEEKTGWMSVKPHFLFYDWAEARQEIDVIYKRIPYEVATESDKKKEILYEEVHVPGKIEYHLYEIDGRFIKKELDLKLYTELIDSQIIIEPVVNLNNNDFFLTLIANNFVDGEFVSDYSLPAKVLQESLNGRVTRENRVLDIHSNPKLALPREMAEQTDNPMGKWSYSLDKEVLFYDEQHSNADSMKFLTWEGQLLAAKENRDFSIQALCFETGMTPTFLSFYKLLGSGPSETATKFEMMSYKTKKRVNRKQSFLTEGLKSFFINYFMLTSGSVNELKVNFIKSDQTSREMLVNEIINRKNSGLISAITAIMILDDITYEEAEEEVKRIIEENDRSVSNELDFAYKFNSQNEYNDQNDRYIQNKTDKTDELEHKPDELEQQKL